GGGGRRARGQEERAVDRLAAGCLGRGGETPGRGGARLRCGAADELDEALDAVFPPVYAAHGRCAWLHAARAAEIGHSSGTDTLAGVLLGLSLAMEAPPAPASLGGWPELRSGPRPPPRIGGGWGRASMLRPRRRPAGRRPPPGSRGARGWPGRGRWSGPSRPPGRRRGGRARAAPRRPRARTAPPAAARPRRRPTCDRTASAGRR